ncbi:MAG: HD domain-containing protein [Prolixibacteraceae bacterium]|jgi:HD superfamily phosphohydrolase|nr:HD domain-containing protein [Prolixibacteraceae bacterium]
MGKRKINKRKILNDPVYGFINLQSDIIFDLIEHKYFQRLRRIKQLGLSYLVYPGANHTRFEHALGALHLMKSAIDSLRLKDVDISDEEAEAVSIAILLHDIGHGPFSHALEYILVEGVTHEHLSLMLMEELNNEFEGNLELAIRIFRNEYPKRYLHQLVASQLDMDRLDYLRRDSFFSGVVEGTIGSERIIKMLNVRDNNLVVDYKGIYSVEKFLIARRLMYWQVYLHKTVIVAEHLLVKILQRAKYLVNNGTELFAPPNLKCILKLNFTAEDLSIEDNKSNLLKNFVLLDDTDILASIKVWCSHSDKVLSYLANAITNRRLLKIEISDSLVDSKLKDKITQATQMKFAVNQNEIEYFVFDGSITNSIYEKDSENIKVLLKNNETVDLEVASDIDFEILSKTVTKHFLCYPKELDLI